MDLDPLGVKLPAGDVGTGVKVAAIDCFAIVRYEGD